MIEDHDKLELRSDEFKEILGTPPKWIVQYGTTFVVLGFFIIALFSYFFTYPDIVKADIKIGTVDPPVSILAEEYGHLDNIVEEQSIVKKGDIVAILREDSGDANDILELDETVRALEKFKNEFVDYEEEEDLRLGSVEPAYLSFVQLHRDQNFSRVSSFQSEEINRLEFKKDAIKRDIEFLNDQMIDIDTSIAYLQGAAKEQLQKLIALEKSSVPSVREQQERVEKVRSLERDQENIEQRIWAKEREIDDINAEQLRLREGTKNEASSRITELRLKLIDLREAINKWKKEHLIIAPISGKVYYTDLLKAGDVVAKKNARIMAIVPLNAENMIQGKMYVSPLESGKIRKDQPVNIRFNSYPSAKYGLLMGNVADKAKIPHSETGKVFVRINIDSLVTTSGDVLPFEHDMQGFAHIITEDRPLLFRFFDYFLSED